MTEKFSLKDMQLKAHKKVTLQKKHPLKANMSTIQLYPGAHKITLQINGAVSELVSFVIE